MRRRASWRVCLWATMLGALACTAGTPEDAERMRTPRVDEGDVVARVHGAPVRLAEVRALVVERGLSPGDALHVLEDALLLEQHAVALGFDRTRATRNELRRASVAALLAETMRDAAPADVAAQRLRYTELLSRLRAHTDVVVHEDTLREVLADSALFGGAAERR